MYRIETLFQTKIIKNPYHNNNQQRQYISYLEIESLSIKD